MRYTIKKGTRVFLVGLTTTVEESFVKHILAEKKCVYYFPGPDTATAEKNLPLGQKIVERVRQYSRNIGYPEWTESGLEVFNLPKSDRGWTHVVVLYRDIIGEAD